MADLDLIIGPSIEDVEAGAQPQSFLDLLDPRGKELYDYWTKLVLSHGYWCRDRMDPMEIARHLTWIILEEWVEERQQSRIRLIGEQAQGFTNGNVTGLCVDDQVDGPVNTLWKKADTLTFIEKTAILLRYPVTHRDREFSVVNDLQLPFGNDKGEKLTLGYVWEHQD